MNTSIQCITVFGATGMLGRPVTEALVQTGFKVKALVRNASAAARQLPAGVQLVPGDLRNPADIEKSLAEADALYLNLSVLPASKRNDFQPEREGIRNVLQAARQSPVRHVAYLSSIVMAYDGFDWWVFDLKRTTAEAIRQSGIPCTIFYPSNFMETIPGKFVQGSRVLLAGTPRYPNYWIAGADYARQVVQAFRNAGAQCRDYVIQGPEALTIDEACAQFVRHYPVRKLRITKVPLGLLKALSPLSGTISYGAKLMEALLQYPETFRAQATWDELGKPTVTIRQYAQALAAGRA
jgi:uncharacterized protein YbjT (DUF2867 family)